MNYKKICIALALFSLTLSLPLFANNNSQIITKELQIDSRAVDNYWTAERLMKAKPMPMPSVDVNAVRELPIASLLHADDKPAGGDGKPPSISVKAGFQQLFIPQNNSVIKQKPGRDTMTLFDRGTAKEDFSSSRLVPITADLTYPYRAVGKLFFTVPGEGDFVCSAAVLRLRVLLTAGHCVHSGSGGAAGYFRNWKFIPAFRDGNAPFQTWNAVYAATTQTWATGNGSVPNAADYAMLELEDRSVSGKIQKIGTVTGYLGYQTLSLIPNHAHLLGYPCNLDQCNKMHQVTAQSARAVSPNNAEYGSDMRGGSSGGPWVQNFGVLADGQTGGQNAGFNRIIAVTSWGYTNTAPKAQGASIFDNRFTTLLDTLCSHKTGNC